MFFSKTNNNFEKIPKDVQRDGSIEYIQAVSMAMDDGKMANDVPKVGSYRAFHLKMAKSMAQNTICTSVFLKNE